MPIQGVVAAVRHVGNKYWIVRRNFEGTNDPFGGLWEFPRGKVAPGESPRDALLREMMEEFGVAVEVGDILATIPVTVFANTYNATFFATMFSGTPTLRRHDKDEWCTVEQLQTGYKYLPSDEAFVQLLTATAFPKVRPRTDSEDDGGDYPSWEALLEDIMLDATATQPRKGLPAVRFAWYHEQITKLLDRLIVDHQIIRGVEKLVERVAHLFKDQDNVVLWRWKPWAWTCPTCDGGPGNNCQCHCDPPYEPDWEYAEDINTVLWPSNKTLADHIVEGLEVQRFVAAT